jgi:6-pyruvoyl-tetrahydropterin synthase
MNSKLSINITNGTLEVEGSEEFVKEIYNDFKELLEKGNVSSPEIKDNRESQAKPNSPPRRSTLKAGSGGSKAKPTGDIKFLTDLNLRPNGRDSLKDYSAKYDIKTGEELSLMIVYYLKEVLKEEKVTLNHLFTAYKELGKKIPQHFRQTLTNQKNAKNWIDVSDWEDIKYTIPGMNHMEHDIVKVKNHGN